MPNLPLSATPRQRGALAVLHDRIIAAPPVSKKRKAVALAIAVSADLLQMVLWPAFAGGAVSPFDDALDAVVAVALLLTLGFSARLVVGLAIELTPGAALFPTWSAVVASIPAHRESEEPAGSSSDVRARA